MSKNTLEYVHIPSNLGDNIRIFEHILFFHYKSPNKFLLDGNKVWNLNQIKTRFIADLDDRISYYNTNLILLLFGDDF